MMNDTEIDMAERQAARYATAGVVQLDRKSTIIVCSVIISAFLATAVVLTLFLYIRHRRRALPGTNSIQRWFSNARTVEDIERIVPTPEPAEDAPIPMRTIPEMEPRPGTSAAAGREQQPVPCCSHSIRFKPSSQVDEERFFKKPRVTFAVSKPISMEDLELNPSLPELVETSKLNDDLVGSWEPVHDTTSDFH